MPQVGAGVACTVASVTSSASLSSGVIPTVGRHGAGCGESLGGSSVFTWGAVARESNSVFTH